jgi:hypothetical protein
MSGVAVQSGQAQRPIIACAEGLIGWLTQRYRIGIPVDVSSAQSIINAIMALRNDKELAATLGRNGYLKFGTHTTAEFGQTLWTTIEGRLK